ncbi:MAG: hypothetical protein R3F59_00295 [Myxococcota bacterium]
MQRLLAAIDADRWATDQVRALAEAFARGEALDEVVAKVRAEAQLDEVWAVLFGDAGHTVRAVAGRGAAPPDPEVLSRTLLRAVRERGAAVVDRRRRARRRGGVHRGRRGARPRRGPPRRARRRLPRGGRRPPLEQAAPPHRVAVAAWRAASSTPRRPPPSTPPPCRA